MNKSVFSLLFSWFPASVTFFSVAFAVLFVSSLVIYWLLPKHCRWPVLLVASVIFYLFFTWWFSLFVFTATIVTYLIARKLNRLDDRQRDYLLAHPDLAADEKKTYKKRTKKAKQRWLTLGILAVLSLLLVMKYADFVIDNINGVSRWFGGDGLQIRHLNWLLPLGISFYTFQIIGYLADVYWGKVLAERNFAKYSLFILFFPKIMQGPIIRYQQARDTLFETKTFDYKTFTNGLKRLAYGLFKKLVIADCLAVFVTWAFGNVAKLAGGTAFTVIFAYLIQDYCDFSGYMDIIIGISLCFGVTMPENFERPYFARTIEEYWRRWHMTLGAWFKDYIFYPLSMSKFSRKLGSVSKKIFGAVGKVVPAIFGLLVVWFLTGLWHGASWHYIVWGLFYGAIIIFNVATQGVTTKLKQKLHINDQHWAYQIFQHLRTIFILIIGRIIFIANSLPDAFTFIGRIFTPWNSFDCDVIGLNSLLVSMCLFVVVLVVDLIQEIRPQTSFTDKLQHLWLPVRWTLYLALMTAVIWLGYYGAGLTPVEFGYVNF